MRILFLAEEVPVPPDQGDRIRAYHLIRELARQHELKLLAFSRQHDGGGLADRYSLEGVEVVEVRRAPWEQWAGIGRHPLWPVTAAFRWSPSLSRKLKCLVGGGGFAAVVAYQLKMAPYLALVKGPRRVVDLTDCVSLYLQRHLPFAPALRHTALAWEARKAARLERQVAEVADLVIVSSEDDRLAIRRLAPGAAVAVIPNGVAPTTDSGIGTYEQRAIVFVGNLAYPPNQDAVRWFVQEVFPKVRERVPTARFLIVGKNPAAAVLALRSLPGVEVTGAVPDVGPYIERAAVVVNPVRFGTGTRIKLLEALARGKAVVSTPSGAAGLELRPGQDLLLADDAEEFADKVVFLLQNRDAALGLGREGRRAVDKFRWDLVARQYEEILTKVVGSPGAPLLDTGDDVVKY